MKLLNVEIPKIPENLEDWNADLINQLIKFPGIERDNFDFKSKPNKLEEHICAFANTKGGIIVLGIEPIKSDDDKHVIGYEKKGFTERELDSTHHKISQSLILIEPCPEVDSKDIRDDEQFFIVLKIENKTSSKPFFINNQWQSFIRINESTIKANRDVILQLYAHNLDQLKNIKNLHSCLVLIKIELSHVISDASRIEPHSPSTLPSLDLSFLRNAVLNNVTFLEDIDKFSGGTESMMNILYVLEKINSSIRGYNAIPDPHYRESVLNDFDFSSSRTLAGKIQQVETAIKNTAANIERHLKKYG